MGREPVKGLAGRQGGKGWGPKQASPGLQLRQLAVVPVEVWQGLSGMASVRASAVASGQT